jgi:GTP-binding protein LepA
MSSSPCRIRNFCVIAHIDHGKSTLSDRFLDLTGLVDDRTRVEQRLDTMDIERERGITIKSQAVRMPYKAADGQVYEFNLMDTPGHVDFTYEVSRALTACEGAILVVDAVQGVEAQTLANVYLAVEAGLEIVPVINKIDLPGARVDDIREQVEEIVGLPGEDCLPCSAKTGEGVPAILEAVIQHVPPPEIDTESSLRALVIDSHYDQYLGVICYVRVREGEIRKGDKIKSMTTGATWEVDRVGHFEPELKEDPSLVSGQVGFLTASIKDIRDVRVGDTLTSASGGATEPLPGYQEVKPVVFAGLYAADNSDYENLREALGKLQLNDAALTYEPDVSEALGFGFRCGFLGLLHMEIVQARLENDYDLDLVTTSPSVVYTVHRKDGAVEQCDNPSKCPDLAALDFIEEPWIEAKIHMPERYIGSVNELVQEKRGEFGDLKFLGPDRVCGTYLLPFAEIVVDFYDKLKSRTQGYASLEYEMLPPRRGDLVRMDIHIQKEAVDALAFIVPRQDAFRRGNAIVVKLKELIPRQMFEVPIQAVLGAKPIARATVKALRKNVIAKCYGGDISRKRKLLEKQKKGKKRMKMVGNVEIPQSAFMAILSSDGPGGKK